MTVLLTDVALFQDEREECNILLGKDESYLMLTDVDAT
jgi:hypothetical protein